MCKNSHSCQMIHRQPCSQIMGSVFTFFLMDYRCQRKSEREREREWDRERASSSLSKTEGIMSWVGSGSPYLDIRQMGRGNGGNEADTILHKRNVFMQTVSRWQMTTALPSYLHSCLFAWQTPLAEVPSKLKAYFVAYNQILPTNTAAK